METSPAKHQKHTALSRPNLGYFHRSEWAILGAPCGVIQRLSQRIMESLAEDHFFGYVDADHGASDHPREALMPGARWQYTDKIGWHQYQRREAPNEYGARTLTNHLDAVLINGNHFRGKRQVVILHPEKKDSLRRKLDRLTDVQLVLLAEGVPEIFPFVQDVLAAQDEAPILRLAEERAIVEWFAEQMRQALPPLYGLVLAGGQSRRMGEDKGSIDYHGRPQRDHVAGLLQPFCEQVFLSVRPDQVERTGGGQLPVIADTFTGLGPLGGILSAFREYPDVAWLTLAADLPLLDETSLAQLAAMRNGSRFATAFTNPSTGFPEPLVTIWEPRSYPAMLQFLAQGYSCPRKVLINSDITAVDPADPDALFNVNNPQEREKVRERLAKK